MNIIRQLSNQFKKPTGVGGKIMAFMQNRINGKQYQATIKHLAVSENDSILDIGFGNGFAIKQLLKEKPNKVFGIEISEDMIVSATKRNQNAVNEGKVEFLKANVCDLPFADNSFDKIYTINTVYFWENTNKAFAEIKRVLKPNGLFINTVYTKSFLDKVAYTKYNYRKFEIGELEKITTENGFELRETVEIEKGKSYGICAERKFATVSRTLS